MEVISLLPYWSRENFEMTSFFALNPQRYINGEKNGGTLTQHICIRVPFDFFPQVFLLGCLLLNFVLLNDVLCIRKGPYFDKQ